MSQSSGASRDTLGGQGTPRPPAVQPEVGARIGRYVVVDRLGAGAMGVVYAAWDPELDRRVALKLLGGGEHRSREGHTRLVREAQALARLSHPNVVGVHDVGTVDDQVWIAMEFVQGQTLDLWLRGRRRSWSAILEIMAAAGRGLAAAHAAGLVHRDFKPENVMVGDDGRVRVMDFGLARAQSPTGSPDPEVTATGSSAQDAAPIGFTRTGAMVGTPAYMAPEQHARLPIDARSDQFSFCVSLWQALYRERPFDGGTVVELAANVIAGRLRSPPSRARVPAWLRRAITRGLDHDAAKRWPTMDELLDALARGRARARLRKPLFAVALLGIAVLGGLGERKLATQRRANACERTGSELAERWDPATRARVRAGIAAAELPEAELAATRIVDAIDRDVEAWTHARTESCLDADVRGTLAAEPAERSRWCLEEQGIAIAALIEQLPGAEPDSIRAAAIDSFQPRPIARCVDSEALPRLPPAPPVAARDEVLAIHAELARATTILSSDQLAAALATARGQLVRAEALGWTPLVADVRQRIGDLLERMGRFDEAEAALEQAWFDAMRSGAYDVAVRAGSSLIFVVGFELARHREGLLWSREVELAIEQRGDPDRLWRAALLSHRATVEHAQGDYAACHASVTEVLAIQEQVLEPDDPRLAQSLGDLANVEMTLGNFERARELLERTLEVEEVAFGPSHPRIAVTILNLANVERQLGDLAEAQRLFEHGIAVQRAALGPRHPELGSTLNNLAALYVDLHDDRRAVELIEESLALKRAVLGEEHPDVAMGLANLAGIVERLGERRRARELLEQALAIYETTMGTEHHNVALTLFELADLAVQEGRNDDAIVLLERELAVLAHSPMARHEISAARLLLAEALWAGSGTQARAIDLARAARDQLREAGADTQRADEWLAEHRLR